MSKPTSASRWAWIPSFTYGINFTQRVKVKKKDDEWRKLNKDEEKYIYETILKYYLDCDLNEILKGEYYEIYSKKHVEKDKPEELKEFLNILFVNKENKIPYVLFFKFKEIIDIQKEDIFCFGKIEYDINENNIATGLIKINVLYPYSQENKDKENNFEKEKRSLYNEIYVCVRDIYHDHLFHHDGEDFLLSIVEAPDKTKATEQIIYLFECKIQDYMHILEEYTSDLDSYALKDLKDFIKKATERIIFSKNGMIYARRFIELADMKESTRSQFEKVFTDAYNSFEDFNKIIVERHKFESEQETERLTSLLITFTVIITFLTFIIAIDAGLGIYREIFSEYGLIKFLYVLFFISLVAILIIALIKYKKKLYHIFKSVKY